MSDNSADLGRMLLSSGPAEAADASGLMQFGRFVGSWAFEGREVSGDGSEQTDRGTITIGWILGGHALQDVWTETYRSDGRPFLLGTTVRFYDRNTNTWHSVWHDPINGVVKQFVGRATRDGIAFESVDGEGTALRWSFTDVMPNSFSWYGEHKVNGVWQRTDDLRVVRAPPNGLASR